MTSPRLEINLTKVEDNARTLVQRLGDRGVRVTGVTKAALGAPEVAAAFQRGGVTGLADSRVQNLRRLRTSGSPLPRTLLRSPMLSDVDAVVREASVSFNTEPTVLLALGDAAHRRRTTHGIVLMVELGDLREGVAPDALVALAETIERHAALDLAGIGTNLACQSGIAPDDSKMHELSTLAETVEARLGRRLAVVSGGNSANLTWAMTTADLGRVNDLRLGESILLGTEPLYRTQVAGLHTDACVLIAEVIEVQTKPAQPWGTVAQAAFGVAAPRNGAGARRQALLAIGRQDVDPDGIAPPTGCTVLGASSDHLVLDIGAQGLEVGDEVAFGLDYSALVRSMTSPFVTQQLDAPWF